MPLYHKLKNDISIKISHQQLGRGIVFEGEMKPPKILEELNENKKNVSYLHKKIGVKIKGSGRFEKNWIMISIGEKMGIKYNYPMILYLRVDSNDRVYNVKLEVFKEKPLRKGLKKRGCGSVAKIKILSQGKH